MNIISVIPLSRARGVPPELSYFTTADVPAGAIVTVPMRSKSINAIVTKSENAEDLKIGIKNAPFEIKKLSKVKTVMFFPASFIESAKILSDYYAATMGAVIDVLVAAPILENAAKIVPPIPAQASFGDSDSFKSTPPMTGMRLPKPRSESDRVFAVQGDDADRMSSWRSLIRQEFARKRSIAIYAPTVEECEHIYNELEKGIEGYIFILNSSLGKKKIVDTWQKIADAAHPVVVIATGSFSLLPRSDIETVIIERENGRGWITQQAPYLDLRRAVETISSKNKQTVFLADSMLRTETLERLNTGEIEQGSPFKWRSISDARDSLVDMRREATPESDPSPFRVISPELESLVRSNQENNTHLFILTLRKGHSTITVCQDCDTVVLCNNCSAPVVLHTSPNGKNFFMCHKCGERRSADETCSNCGGWRLAPLGIGIDRVHEELQSRFSGIDIFKLDSDSVKNDKEADEIIKKFKLKPGSILLGTEYAFLRLSENVDHSAIVSLDSLFALPDFRIQEKIMSLLIRLRAQSVRSILVQTRRPDEKVFEYGLKGNLSDFHRAAIAERKQFSYPPFSVLIKLTIEGKKDAIAVQMAEVRKLLEPHEVDVFPAFTATLKGNSVIHGLLKIESHAWPDTDLVSKLRSLPPNVSVKADPESLL